MRLSKGLAWFLIIMIRMLQFGNILLKIKNTTYTSIYILCLHSVGPPLIKWYWKKRNCFDAIHFYCILNAVTQGTFGRQVLSSITRDSICDARQMLHSSRCPVLCAYLVKSVKFTVHLSKNCNNLEVYWLCLFFL